MPLLSVDPVSVGRAEIPDDREVGGSQQAPLSARRGARDERIETPERGVDRGSPPVE